MKSGNRSLLTVFAAGVLLLLAVVSASAVEVVGQVTNGTTGRPVPGVFVNLIALRGQMVPVRETETDAQGRFRMVVAANPNERFLVQVPFQGIIYTEPAALSGSDTLTVNVQVFESGAPPSDLVLEAHTVILEPHSNHLRVNEFYALRNASRPPRTLPGEGGSFRFALPGSVGDLQVSAGRPGGMSLRQSPQQTDTENAFALAYDFKPGETEIQVSYALPLSGNNLELTLPLLRPTARRHIAVPREGVRVESRDVREIEQSQAPQLRVYSVATVAPGALPLRLEIDPAALQAATSTSVAPSAGAPAAGESQVQIVAHPVSQARWYIVTLLLVILSVGLYYLYSLQPSAKTTDAPSSHSSRGADRR